MDVVTRRDESSGGRTAAILYALGVPAPGLMTWLTISVKVIGGLAVLLVAMFTVHWPFGFLAIKLRAVTAAGPQFGPPGYEVDVLYIACLVALVLGGPGPLALDNVPGRRKDS
jgi:putative oxidoreductase